MSQSCYRITDSSPYCRQTPLVFTWCPFSVPRSCSGTTWSSVVTSSQAPLGYNSVSGFPCFWWPWQFEDCWVDILENAPRLGFVWRFSHYYKRGWKAGLGVKSHPMGQALIYFRIDVWILAVFIGLYSNPTLFILLFRSSQPWPLGVLSAGSCVLRQQRERPEAAQLTRTERGKCIFQPHQASSQHLDWNLMRDLNPEPT